MTIAEKIAVMQAYLDGKQIQISSHRNKGYWEDYGECEPTWDWQKFDYRVKPEVKVRPYTFKELVEAIKVHGVVVRSKEGVDAIYTIVHADDTTIRYHFHSVEETYQQFLEYNIWLDGSPCGVVEE